MPIVRLDLRNGEWIERETDPSRKQLKEIERLTRQALDTDTPSMNTEDALILTLVKGWSFAGEDGAPIAVSRAAIDILPGSKTQPMLEDLAAIYDFARGANPSQRLDASWRMCLETLSVEKRERMAELHRIIFEDIFPNQNAGKD